MKRRWEKTIFRTEPEMRAGAFTLMFDIGLAFAELRQAAAESLQPSGMWEVSIRYTGPFERPEDKPERRTQMEDPRLRALKALEHARKAIEAGGHANIPVPVSAAIENQFLDDASNPAKRLALDQVAQVYTKGLVHSIESAIDDVRRDWR